MSLSSWIRRRFDRPVPDDAKPLVAFVTMTEELRPFSVNDAGYSPLASVRLRVLAPAAAVAANARVMFVPLKMFMADPALGAVDGVRAIVLGKLSTAYLLSHRKEISGMLERMGRLSPAPALFADLSDDYAAMGAMLGEPFLADYQSTLARLCALTVPCEALAERLRPLARHGIHVIEDPWESPRLNPPAAPQAGLARLCWFGNLGDTNHELVATNLVQVAASLRGVAARLRIVAGQDRAHLVEDIRARISRENPELALESVHWSLDATWHAIDDCDIVLLPQDTAGEWGKVKSHNRLVEAIRGGRIAVASPIPSYRELADYAWVGEALPEGVAWALSHPQAAALRVAAGQASIATRFSPQSVGRRWREVLFGNVLSR